MPLQRVGLTGHGYELLLQTWATLKYELVSLQGVYELLLQTWATLKYELVSLQ